MRLFKNALIPFGGKEKIADILFDDKILKIDKNIVAEASYYVEDLKGKLLLPGCIDAHVHFNDPGYTNHEDFYSGTLSAAFGGITTVIDMPCTSIPAVTNKENMEEKLSVIEKKAVVDFALWGGIKGNNFPPKEEDIHNLWNAGVVGFKIYTISGMDTFRELSYKQIAEMFEKYPDILFAFHAEDKNIIETALQNITPNEMKLPENYIKTRPIEAEFKAVSEILKVAKNVHFVHISSKKATKLIIENKKSTFETCPHYLQFIQNDLLNLKGRLKIAPVVKYQADKNYLRECLKNGKLDFVTTDHAGCDYETEKKFEDFSKVYSGIPGTEFLALYIISEFYIKEKVPINRIVEILSQNQAKRYGLYPNKGSLEIGTDADFTIIDLEKEFYVDEKKLHSLGKYSPFNGQIFGCSVDKTIIRGTNVISNGKIKVSKGFGKFIKRRN